MSDESGRGLGSVEVRVYEGDVATGMLVEPAATTTMTAADGTYRVESVAATYVVIAFVDKTDTHRDGMWDPPFYSGRSIRDAAHWWSTKWLDGKTGVNQFMPSAAWHVANRVHRTAGADRYQTAVNASRSNFPAATDVVLVSGVSFADGLAAAPWAGLHDAPILLTQSGRVPSAVVNEIKRLGSAAGTASPKIWIVGGEASVSSAVVRQLQSAGLRNIARFGGADRYAVAAGVARACQKISPNKEPFIVRGDTFTDALAVSPFAYMERRPMLLVTPQGLPPATKNAWAAMRGEADDIVIAVGGVNSITDRVLAQLDSVSQGNLRLPGGDSIYYPGGDRYSLPLALVRFYRSAWGMDGGFDKFAIASGEVFPDALAGSAAAGYNGAPMLLTNATGLHPAADTTMMESAPFIVDAELFGGRLTLPDRVLRGARKACGNMWYDYDSSVTGIPLPPSSFLTVQPPNGPVGSSIVRPPVHGTDAHPGAVRDSGLVEPLSR